MKRNGGHSFRRTTQMRFRHPPPARAALKEASISAEMLAFFFGMLGMGAMTYTLGVTPAQAGAHPLVF